MVTYSDLYDRLIRGEEKLALVGLGYVGMPIAVEIAKHVKVIGVICIIHYADILSCLEILLPSIQNF